MVGREKMNEITISIDGKTEDSNDDVFTVRLHKSHLSGCVHSKGINVWSAHSYCHGDLKRMMNAITKRFEKSHILFTMVVNNQLASCLQGFKEKQLLHPQIGEMMTCLEGEWKVESK